MVVFLTYVNVASMAGRLVRKTGFVLPLAGGLKLGSLAALGLLTQQASTDFGLVWFGSRCSVRASASLRLRVPPPQW
ncbi:hypothetical protein HQO44_16170 [Rhodococcus fascians]|nr:hypothetical protein [Rhodococcus fascians]